MNIKTILTKDTKTVFSSGMFHLFSSTAIAQGLGLATTIIVTRLLLPSDVGHIGVITAVMGFAGIVAGFGLNTAVLKYVSEPITQIEKEKILFHALTGTLIMSLLITTIAFIGTYIPGILADEVALYYLRFFVWTLPFSAIFSVITCYFHGEKKIKKKAIIELAQRIFLFVAAVIGVYFWALSGYIFANIFIITLAGGLSVFLLQKHIKRFKLDLHLIKKMFRFGGFSFLANEFALVVSTADILCISFLLKDASLVGFYYIAVALTRGFGLIPSAIMQTALPYISEKSIDAQSTQNLYFKLLKKMTLLMIFVCIVLYLVGGKILVLLFGNSYIQSVPVFNVLLIGLFFWSVGSVSGITLLGRGRPDLNFYTVLIEGIINIALNIVFIIQMGIIGAAVATSITYFIRFVINYSLCQYDLKH